MTLDAALCEVRKAHRLIYSYQERMLSLVHYIQHRLGYSSFEGVKHFSEDIKRNRQSGALKIHDDMWAWDFIYSYLFEYFIGGIIDDRNRQCLMSVIQYTDTGYFDSEEEDRTNPEKFAAEENSSSKLLFFLEIVPPKCKSLWDAYEYTEEYVLNKKYASLKHTNTILYPKGKGKNAIVLYSVPISEFADEKSSLESIRKFVEFCKKKDLFDFDIQ